MVSGQWSVVSGQWSAIGLRPKLNAYVMRCCFRAAMRLTLAKRPRYANGHATRAHQTTEKFHEDVL
ncbi:MAG: hypothetical protein F6J90_07895 [Moorea sp. SIOASIH]|uniref:hypothetical protein n=1 Tax=Moorena sp. SIOASIH TaxID=2607817 RepID=UPI0013B8E989|nr:hypothetical protein [Moorena sp. SIOASIH]NEO36246.1 hypothetical protein [Moorena sp. SIOASIH]